MASKIGSSNGFAVLESLKKKKNSSKNKGSLKSQVKEPEQVFWNPKPLVNKSWADVEDEDDYLATSPPLKGIWGSSEPANQRQEVEAVIEEESESDDDFAEGDEEIEEEPEPEPEFEALIPAEPVEKKPLAATTSAPKDTERQLSKKELKKKGLEELEALLAELGISGKDNNMGMECPNEGKKSVEQIVEGEKKGSSQPAPIESKTSKKKKKKDKSSNEAKDSQEQQVNGDNNGAENEEASAAVDVKERVKKAVGMVKKKKTNKEMDAAAKAAAIEAATRSARLAAAKKKAKNHYNQQPVR